MGLEDDSTIFAVVIVLLADGPGADAFEDFFTIPNVEFGRFDGRESFTGGGLIMRHESEECVAIGL